MTDLFRDNIDIYKGLQKAFQQMRSESQNAYLKILNAQEHFFDNHPELNLTFREQSRELLKAALRKFEYAAMVVGQMHSLRELRLLRPIPNPPNFYAIPPEGENEFPYLDELLFDQALFLWRSFLDFYMKYLVYFCTNKYVVNMSVREFNKAFCDLEAGIKSKSVNCYFQKNVFNKESKSGNWGNILRSYRDKTAHNKLLVLTLKEITTPTGHTVIEPTTKGQEISFFVQEKFDTNAFEMLRKLFPILYEIDWIAGPYRPGMFSGN